MLPDDSFFSYHLESDDEGERFHSELNRMLDSTLATKGTILEKNSDDGLFVPVYMTAQERKKVEN